MIFFFLISEIDRTFNNNFPQISEQRNEKKWMSAWTVSQLGNELWSLPCICLLCYTLSSLIWSELMWCSFVKSPIRASEEPEIANATDWNFKLQLLYCASLYNKRHTADSICPTVQNVFKQKKKKERNVGGKCLKVQSGELIEHRKLAKTCNKYPWVI